MRISSPFSKWSPIITLYGMGDRASVVFAEHAEAVVVSEKSLLVIIFKSSMSENFWKVVLYKESQWKS